MAIKTFTYKRKSGKYYLEIDFWEFGSDKTMDSHIDEMLSNGWELLNSGADAGHVRVGKTLGLAAVTGGLSLLFGASRTPETLTLTFRRADSGQKET